MTTRSAFRRTRNSDVIGELKPPYDVELLLARFSNGTQAPNLVHTAAKIKDGRSFNTCCRLQQREMTKRYNADADAPTCLACVTCRGCYCCRPGHIREETMFMGKWETKDGRILYPFEMDSTHLLNSIAKLKRDESHFKARWEDWVRALECEARLRCLL